MVGCCQAGRVRAAPRAGRGPAASATDREVTVVAAVVAAGSEKAAAHRLGLSHSTVKHHLANARSKVGATTTAQLVWILAERFPERGPWPGRTTPGLLDEVVAHQPLQQSSTAKPIRAAVQKNVVVATRLPSEGYGVGRQPVKESEGNTYSDTVCWTIDKGRDGSTVDKNPHGVHG